MKYLYGLLMIVLVCNCHGQSHNEHSGQVSNNEEERDRERWMWQLPQHVLNTMGNLDGKVVADIGCGDGYFTFYLSRNVGENGLVFASDIDKTALSAISERAVTEKIGNIRVVLGSPDNPNIPERAADIALLVNVTHLVKNRELFFSNIAKGLKDKGTMIIVQWDVDKLGVENPWTPDDNFLEPFLLESLDKSGFEVYQTNYFLPLQKIYFCRMKCYAEK